MVLRADTVASSMYPMPRPRCEPTITGPAPQLKRVAQRCLPHLARQVRAVESSSECERAHAQTGDDQGPVTMRALRVFKSLLEHFDHFSKDPRKDALDGVVVPRDR